MVFKQNWLQEMLCQRKLRPHPPKEKQKHQPPKKKEKLQQPKKKQKPQQLPQMLPLLPLPQLLPLPLHQPLPLLLQLSLECKTPHSMIMSNANTHTHLPGSLPMVLMILQSAHQMLNKNKELMPHNNKKLLRNKKNNKK
jgi:hypothetical protein